MNDERKIGDYTVIRSLELGGKEILLCENKNDELRYMCCYFESNELFERPVDCLASANYLEIMSIYIERCEDQLEWCNRNIPKNIDIFKSENCIDFDSNTDLIGKIIVIKPDSLHYEFQSAIYQLGIVTGGNGARPNALGRKVYYTELSFGKQKCIYRNDIMGIAKDDCLPQWAKSRINQKKEKKGTDRGER